MEVTFGWYLDGASYPPTSGGRMAALGCPVVGPQGLLTLIEARLGLTAPETPPAVRIAQYYARLAVQDDGQRFYSHSFRCDGWATARALLAWRDDLYAAGWSGGRVPGGGARLDTLAGIETPAGRGTGDRTVAGPTGGGCPSTVAASTGERLSAVIDALAGGRRSGVARLRLVTRRQDLPPRWAALIDLLADQGTILEDVPPLPAAAAIADAVATGIDGAVATGIHGADGAGSGDLAALQRVLARRGGADPALLCAAEPGNRQQGRPLTGDGSFVVFDAADEFQAADAVASWMAAETNNDGLILLRGEGAGVLDAACAARGLPRPGLETRSPWRGALQVLPLFFETLWQPLNARRMLEFLSLVALPLPRFVARRFAEAFREQPGIDGPAWQQAWTRVREEHNRREAVGGHGPGGDNLSGVGRGSDDLGSGNGNGSGNRISINHGNEHCDRAFEAAAREWSQWLTPPRFDPDTGIPAAEARGVCQRVARWAAGRGERTGDAMFKVAAGQAAALGEAITAAGLDAITRVQLGRMLDAVAGAGSVIPGGDGEAAPWSVLRDPGSLWAPADTVIWWGFVGAAGAVPALPWSAKERAALAAASCLPEAPEREVLRRAAAWRQPVLLARRRLILVVPRARNGVATPVHPLWHEIRARVRAAGGLAAVRVDVGALARTAALTLAGRAVRRQAEMRRPLPAPRRLWAVAAGLVAPRDIESYTGMDRLIRCPLSWVLHYPGRLRRGALLSLPEDEQLVGTLAHAVLERLVGAGREWPPDQAAAEAASLFDRMAPTTALPLLRPGQGVEYQRARRAVAEAIRTLFGMITEAGLTVAGAEVNAEAPFGTGRLTGIIDLLLRDSVGRLTIIDLKWARSARTRQQELAQGRACQLAAYAWLERSLGHRVAGAGFFLLKQASLYVSEPQPFPSVHHVAGTNLVRLWEEMETTYRGRLAAMAGGLISARGVAEVPGEAPGSSDPVTDTLPLSDMNPLCGFCDFNGLCRPARGGAES